MMLSKRNLVFQIAFFWWTMLNFGMVNFNFLMDPYFLWICVFPSEKLCGFLSVFTSWTFSRSYKMGPYYHGYIMGPAPIAMAENKLVFHWSFFHKWSDMGIYWNNLVTLCPSYTLGIPWGFRACKALGTFGHPELPGALRFGEWKKKHSEQWPLKHCFGTVCKCSLLVEFFSNRLFSFTCILFSVTQLNSSSWNSRPTSVTRSKIFRSFTSIRRGSVKSRRQDHVAKSPPALPDSFAHLRFAPPPHGKLRFRTETLDKVISAPKMSKAF